MTIVAGAGARPAAAGHGLLTKRPAAAAAGRKLEPLAAKQPAAILRNEGGDGATGQAGPSNRLAAIQQPPERPRTVNRRRQYMYNDLNKVLVHILQEFAAEHPSDPVAWLVEHLCGLTEQECSMHLACLERRRRLALLKAQEAKLTKEKREQAVTLRRLQAQIAAVKEAKEQAEKTAKREAEARAAQAAATAAAAARKGAPARPSHGPASTRISKAPTATGVAAAQRLSAGARGAAVCVLQHCTRLLQRYVPACSAEGSAAAPERRIQVWEHCTRLGGRYGLGSGSSSCSGGSRSGPGAGSGKENGVACSASVRLSVRYWPAGGSGRSGF